MRRFLTVVAVLAILVVARLASRDLINWLDRLKPGTKEPLPPSVSRRHQDPPAPQPTREARPYAVPREPVRAPVPTTQTADQRRKAPVAEQPLFEMPAVAQVYVLNATKKYYPLDCEAPRPEGAYRMAKSQAVSQGYTLAPECVR